MGGLMAWVNKNPKLAGGGALAVIAVITLLGLYFGGVIGGGGSSAGTATAQSQPLNGANGGTTAGAASGGTTAGASADASGAGAAGGSGNPFAMGGAGAGAATPDASGGGGDPDALPKKRIGARSANPFAPAWQRLKVVSSVGGTTVVTPWAPLFTPPTPTVFVASRPIEGAGGPGAAGLGAAGLSGQEPQQRMAGILYNNDRVLAVVERSENPNEPAAGYIVQPGDMIGENRDRKVISITPDSIVVEHNGQRETLPLKAGSLKGLPPARTISSGYGSNGFANPYGAGVPENGGGGPGMSGGYPGMPSPPL